MAEATGTVLRERAALPQLPKHPLGRATPSRACYFDKCSHRDNNLTSPSAPLHSTQRRPRGLHGPRRSAAAPTRHFNREARALAAHTAEQGTPPTYPPLLGLLARHHTHSRIRHAARPSPPTPSSFSFFLLHFLFFFLAWLG